MIFFNLLCRIFLDFRGSSVFSLRWIHYQLQTEGHVRFISISSPWWSAWRVCGSSAPPPHCCGWCPQSSLHWLPGSDPPSLSRSARPDRQDPAWTMRQEWEWMSEWMNEWMNRWKNELLFSFLPGDIDAQTELLPSPDVEAQAVVVWGGVEVDDPLEGATWAGLRRRPSALLHHHPPVDQVHPGGFFQLVRTWCFAINWVNNNRIIIFFLTRSSSPWSSGCRGLCRPASPPSSACCCPSGPSQRCSSWCSPDWPRSPPPVCRLQAGRPPLQRNTNDTVTATKHHLH